MLAEWEKRIRERVAAFVEGWTWERVFRVWSEEFGKFPVSASPLFTEVAVHDPASPAGGKILFLWCRPHRLRGEHVRLQRCLDESPGTGLNAFLYFRHLREGTRKGEVYTLRYLWDNRENPEAVAAVLICASLFPLVCAGRRDHLLENWPPVPCMKVVFRWAMERWSSEERDRARGWHHACTEVLPDRLLDWRLRIGDMETLIRHFAKEHARVLARYRPVAAVFGPKRDPFVERRLQKEYLEERRRYAEWEREQREEEARRKAEEERRRREHPRWGEWGKLSRGELERLVWSRPVVSVAREFGVSDVAVAKKCRKLGVAKPPPGFWAKVKAGRLPHPCGVPPRKDRPARQDGGSQ